jgi:3-oxoacyl-[acyl-carrier-protein] synthase-1
MSGVSPIAVTGYATCNALGLTRSEVVDALYHGRSGLTKPPFDLAFDTVSGIVRTPLPELPSELTAWSTRPARMAAALLEQLNAPLQVARNRYAPHRIGVLLGTSTAGAEATEAAYRSFVDTGSLPSDYDFRRQHTYGAILDVVRRLTGVSGPSWMVSTTCTSSAKPLASAMRLIKTNVIDAAVVGGIDTLCAMTLTGFNSLAALSNEVCRPFSSERKGINIGEGGSFLLVERAGSAGDNVHALIAGVGESSDAYHISAPHPEGLGAQTAMERALAQAGWNAQTVDHVNAHGTGTPLNDIAESKAISRVFGDEVPVVSTKGYTGHALGGAGAIEAVFSIIAIEEGFVPASLGCLPLDPKITINVRPERRTGTFKRVLSSSFAFGGNNVCVALRSP